MDSSLSVGLKSRRESIADRNWPPDFTHTIGFCRRLNKRRHPQCRVKSGKPNCRGKPTAITPAARKSSINTELDKKPDVPTCSVIPRARRETLKNPVRKRGLLSVVGAMFACRSAVLLQAIGCDDSTVSTHARLAARNSFEPKRVSRPEEPLEDDLNRNALDDNAGAPAHTRRRRNNREERPTSRFRLAVLPSSDDALRPTPPVETRRIPPPVGGRISNRHPPMYLVLYLLSTTPCFPISYRRTTSPKAGLLGPTPLLSRNQPRSAALPAAV